MNENAKQNAPPLARGHDEAFAVQSEDASSAQYRDHILDGADTPPPQVIPTRHGFLAVSGLGAEFGIGITADTEDEAVGLYAEAVARRRRILARPPFREWTPEQLAQIEAMEARAPIWNRENLAARDQGGDPQ